MIELYGIPVFKGIAMAPAYIYQEAELIIEKTSISSYEVEEALSRFDYIRKQVTYELEELKDKAVKTNQGEEAAIIDAHLVMAEDPMFSSRIHSRIKDDLCSVEQSIEETKIEFMEMFRKTEDPYLKARAADVEDVANRFLSIALFVKSKSLTEIKEDIIIIARDLKPSATIGITSFIKGILLEEGSQNSHAAIIAKAKGIPTIVGLSGLLGSIQNGDIIILDAIQNKVFLKPEEKIISCYRKQKERMKLILQRSKAIKNEEAITKDGVKVKLYGNIESSVQVEDVINYGGRGIGLFRTEFLYMNARSFPTEEEQFIEYKNAVENELENVIIRTLDIGGDKSLPYYTLKPEANPSLGLRALRFTLANTDIFKTQLRAILRASAFGHTSIMFPMVTSLEEVRTAKELLLTCREELRKEQIAFDPDLKVGIMIETPAAAAIADILIHEADFFSIGTNDLCQYTLAVDRMNKEVAYLYQPLHPSILRLIKQTADAAHACKKEVGICGEMAGEVIDAIVLIGLGADELSMSPAVIPEVKSAIRQISYEEAKQIASRILLCKTTEDINKLLNDYYKTQKPYGSLSSSQHYIN